MVKKFKKNFLSILLSKYIILIVLLNINMNKLEQIKNNFKVINNLEDK